jgi:acyl transferase domain-containing protein
VYASPRQTVITGPLEQIEAVIAVVTADNRLARRIDVDVASHHRIVDPILPQVRAGLAGLAPQAAQIPMFSTVDGVDGDPSCDAEYWVANLRHPVRFAKAVAAASVAHTTFIEISPHPLLTFAISDTLGDTHHHALGTLARDTHDTVSFHTALNTTHTTHPPDTEHPPGPHPQLPTTPWCHNRHWITTAVTAPPDVNHPKIDDKYAQAAGADADQTVAGAPAPESQFRHGLRHCPPQQRRQLLVDHVATQASTVMGLTPTELDSTTGFFQLGMDSPMSVTLQHNLSASLGQPLSPTVIFDYPTVDSLAAHLATLLPELADTTDHPHQPGNDPYPGATRDQLLQQLCERLGRPT